MIDTKPYSRRAIFAAACVSMLVFGLVITTLGSVLPMIIDRFGVQKGQAGTLLLLMSLGVLVGSLIFGPVVDRYGYKSLLIVSSAVILAGIQGVAFAESFGLLRMAVFVSGIAGGIINGGASALVADISTDGRSAGLSLLGIFFGVGAFGVPLTMSFLIDRFDYSEIIAGVGVSVLAPLVFFATLRFPAPKQPHGFPMSRGIEIVRNPALLLIGAMLFLQSGIEVSAGGWSAAYFVEELSVDTARAVLYLALFWIGLTIGRWVVGTFLKRADPFRVLAVSIGVGMAGSMLLLLSDDVSVAAIGIFVAGVGFAAIFPYLLGIVGDLFPDISGTAFGVAFAMALTGGSLAPYLIGVLSERFGLRLSLIAIPVSLALMTGLLIAVRRRLVGSQSA